MAKCTSIDPLVTPYVDGELPAAERTLVDDHLNRCPPCHSRVAAEAVVRDLMRARQPGLSAERAPARLHAQCTGLANRSGDASAARLRPGARRLSPARAVRTWWAAPWHLRVVPLALTASLVLLVGGAFLYLATQYSARLLAAELCADHMACFAANNVLGTREAPAAVESSMLSTFGWRLHLPEQFDASGLELVGARRCFYGEGKVAHLMYHDQGRPVSIYMLPKSVRPEELLEMLGHEVAIWSSGDRTFVLITRASRDKVARMASIVKGGATMNPMRIRWGLAAMSALALALLTMSVPLEWPFHRHDAITPGEACPADAKPANLNFTLKDMNNRDVRLSDFKGKVILLDFWATWCGPCKVEIPWFAEFQEKYGAAGLQVVGISVDDTHEQLEPFVTQLKMKYVVLQGLGHDDVQDAYGPMWGIPVTVLISRDGKICAKHTGMSAKEAFEEEIKSLLNVVI